jgi:hypothetical protein
VWNGLEASLRIEREETLLEQSNICRCKSPEIIIIRARRRCLEEAIAKIS